MFVKDGLIAGVGAEPDEPADTVIDAKGMAVTPGFIDIHRHCDAKPFEGSGFGEVLLTQGITTTVVGNCRDLPDAGK